MAYRSGSGGTSVRSGKWEGDMFTAQTREFGSYYIVIDTTPPRITPINILKGKNMHALKNIVVTLRDNLSGVADYHGYIDGKWQLMEMDGKTATVRMAIPAGLAPGTHTFSMTAVDDRNNKTEYSVSFLY